MRELVAKTTGLAVWIKEGTEEPLFRAQNRSIGVQVGEIHDAVSADYA